MRVEAFTDQYGPAAAAMGMPEGELRRRDNRHDGPRQRWLALANGAVAGVVTARSRPDDRVFLAFACPEAAAYGPLTEAAGAGRAVYTTVDAAAAGARAALADAGFATEVEVEFFRVRFDAALAVLGRPRMPVGFSLHPVGDVDADRLFALDNEIRGDVPGSEGWRGNRDWFDDELSDPAAYHVGRDDRTGEYAGLIRIWRNPDGPSLGLLGVRQPHRGGLLAAALLHRALTEAEGWGHPTFATHTSPSNRRVHRHLARLGESVGRSLQLVRRP